MKQLFSIIFFLFFTLAVFCQKAVDLGLSVKWATCNVGANTPEEYGEYYTFDEAQELSNSKWRVPTIEEIDELVRNCDYKWTTQNGVNGGLFTSKKNGNSIFFPAGGYRYGLVVYYEGSNGVFWSSSADSDGGGWVLHLFFSDSGVSVGSSNDGRFSVRLVQDVK